MTGPYLGNPKYTIEVLQKYNFAFQNHKRRFCAGNRSRDRNNDPVPCRVRKRGYGSGN